MVLPWNRRDIPAQAAPGRRRRRRRDEPNRGEEVRRQGARREEERRRQRLAITIGTMLIMAIMAIVAVGYYREFYQPPRSMAGSINDVEFSFGDLVERIRVLQGISRYQRGGIDLGRAPFNYLRELLHAEILRQEAPRLGIFVKREDVDQIIRAQFYPASRAGEEPDPGLLDREFESNYQSFLTQVNLSDDVYRRIIEERIRLQQLAAILGADIPETPEQVEIEWIRLDEDGPVVPEDVRVRLEEEEFAKVADELEVTVGAGRFTGWVPQGAFPDFDPLLFGDEEREVLALEVGGISDPQWTLQEGVYIIKMLSGPEEHELDPQIRRKLNNELVAQWQIEKLNEGSTEGWSKISFDSDRYAWVVQQVRLTAARVREQETENQNQGIPIPGG